MTLLPDVDIGSGTLRFAKDYVGVDYHNDTHTHIDALCHVAFDGFFYNGKPSAALTRTAAGSQHDRGREERSRRPGVLLDVPRLRGVPWLEPGEHVFREDLEAAEREQKVTVGRGDILLVRTGHARRLRELGPWDTAKAKAGLHPTTVLYLAERSVAVLGSDRNGDTAPSTTEGIGLPDSRAHAERDGSPPDRLPPVRGPRPACEREGRWEFLFVAAPLRIVGGTGSPSTRSRSSRNSFQNVARRQGAMGGCQARTQTASISSRYGRG